MAHAINWFEIPAKNFERAKSFYETVLGIKMMMPFPEMKYAMFPADMQNGEIGGGLIGNRSKERNPMIHRYRCYYAVFPLLSHC